MKDQNLIIDKLEGYSGIRLKNNEPLIFRPGINLLVGRNGCGKTNLMRLVQMIATKTGDLKNRIESSYFAEHLKACQKKRVKTIEEKFGRITLVKHRLRGNSGNIKMVLRHVNAEYVLSNIINDTTGFRGHLELICKTVPVRHQYIYGSDTPPKIEMSGHGMSTGLFSHEQDNKVQSIMSGPIRSVSDFIKTRLSEFYSSEEFVGRMSALESETNDRFKRFLGTTNKNIRINYKDIAKSGYVVLSVTDNGNHIRSEDFSTGESILFNLVFSLSIARTEHYDILSLDEPDIHMHDDMIQVLVNELSELSRAVPNCIILVASHSTALIEKLAALGKEAVNIVTFDSERNVGNSKDDVELINALQRNGVAFSPLMLSRRLTIFIENNLQKDNGQRVFFSKFFSPENMPHIVPIGTSGNVQESDSFAEVIQQILRTHHIRSVGIQDGDIWFKSRLTNYLTGKMSLVEFINELNDQKRFYIKEGAKKPNSYFFNLWEIENLFIVRELLPCWRFRNGEVLTDSAYSELLHKNKDIISREYLDTFFKSLTRIRIGKSHSIDKRRQLIAKRFDLIDSCLADGEGLKSKINELVNSILNNDLLNWVPGKEIKRLLERKGYSFDDSGFDYDSCDITTQVRRILPLHSTSKIGGTRTIGL